jgi:hypothetical protein
MDESTSALQLIRFRYLSESLADSAVLLASQPDLSPTTQEIAENR